MALAKTGNRICMAFLSILMTAHLPSISRERYAMSRTFSMGYNPIPISIHVTRSDAADGLQRDCSGAAGAHFPLQNNVCGVKD
jgi:hypothetical protein